MYYLKDPKSNDPSVTLTAFMAGFAVCLVKLLFSGLTFGSFTLSQFSGTDFAAAVGALGMVYVLRRKSDSGKEDNS